MNILSIDFGTKNIGLAWTDTEIGVVLPFGQFTANSSQPIVHRLANFIRQEKIDKVIVGLPLAVGGTGEENVKRVKRFAKDLESEIKVPIEFYDERFSSQQADRMGGEASRDEKAAMVILEGYLGKCGL